jgi:TRAP-type C4-dicarboxylate transport system permease small subunit
MSFWKTIDRIEGGMASVGAGLCLLAMIVITVLSVIGRYILQQDLIPGAYNLIERVTFPLIVFWAVPLAHRQGTFPRFDMVINSFSPNLRRWVSAVVLLVELVVYAVVMWYVLRFTWTSIENDRTMQIGTDFWPIWPILVMLPLAFALMMLEMCRLVWDEISGASLRRAKAESDNVNAAF